MAATQLTSDSEAGEIQAAPIKVNQSPLKSPSPRNDLPPSSPFDVFSGKKPGSRTPQRGPNGSISEIKRKQKRAQWKKILNQDRFFHQTVMVAPKVSKAEISAYMEQVERIEEEKKKEEKAEGKKVLDSGFDIDGSKPKPLMKHDESSPSTAILSSSSKEGGKTLMSPSLILPNGENELKQDSPDLSSKRTKSTDIVDISDGSDEWYFVDKDKLFNDEALHTKDSGMYTYFKPLTKKRPGRRIAFFDGKLKRVTDIKTVEETFSVVFHFYVTWLMSREEVLKFRKAEREGELNDWEPDDYPQFECANRIDGEMERIGNFKIKDGQTFRCLKNQVPKVEWEHNWGKSSWDIHPMDLGFDPRYASWCRVQYGCSFTCAEEMELELFPFDCQDLGVFMRVLQKANEWDILPLPRHGEIFNVNAKYSLVSEWKIPGVMLEFDQGDPNSAKNGVPYSSVIIRVKAERKWEAHVADSGTIFCMYWLGLATFGVPVEEVADRLAYCITLLLTDVATMQLLNENIPKIPYRTFLDTYTYGCFLFLCLITAWVTVSGFDGGSPLGRRADNWAFIAFTGAALILHAFFYFRIKRGHRIERLKLQMDSDGLRKYFEEMSHLGSVSAMPQAGVYWDSRSIRPNENSDIDLKETNVNKGRWAAKSYPWSDFGDSFHIADVPFLEFLPDPNLGVD